VSLAGGRRGHHVGAIAKRYDHILELVLADDNLDAQCTTDLLLGQEAAAVVELLEHRRPAFDWWPNTKFWFVAPEDRAP
jgi:hypothetical protein